MKRALASVLISSICIAVYFFLFAGMKSGLLENERIVNKGNSQIVVPQIESKSFINCIFNDAYESWNHQAWILKFLDRYKDSLHFNTIHYYNYPEVSNYYGSLNFLMTSTQITHNIDMLDSVEAKNLVTYVARQNIEKYCFGQRLLYEVSSNGSTTLNDGFCYQNVMANTYTTDSGRTVLHAKPWPSDNYNNPGYLCKSIYENLQHTDLYDFVQLDGFTWYLRPMMRIDSNVFSINNTTPVVAIVAVNYSGDPIDSIVVRVNNFRNSSNNYRGQYLEKFLFADPNPDSLKTSGSPSTGLGEGRDGDFRLWATNCKVDFRVYWFGQVEVWFDKITVDDERARRLFNPTITELPIDSLIRQEAIELGSHSANLSFFVDEVTYSNYPCINYVDSVLKTTNSDSKIHTAITNYFHVRSFKNNDVGQSVYFKNAHVNSFNADAHIFDLSTKLPNNFSYYDSRIPPSSISSNYEEYNSHLQAAAFGDRNSITPENENVQGNDPWWWGSLVYQIAVCRKNRDLYTDAQFIMQPQLHSNAFKRDDQEYFQFGNREPTNEEIQAQAMISIAHGAEGICWFIYPSVKSVYNSGTLRNYYQGNGPVGNDTFVYNYGLTELLQDDPTLPPRYSNMYGQDKWNYVKKMNIKIEHWKPTLDKIVFDSGHSVHSEGSNHSFISDIKSYYSIAIPPFSSAPVYEDDVKYWEMGFFKPDFENPDVSTNDKSKYFIMVNRRCYPENDNQGDFRQLKIKFNSSQLTGFKNWKIIDLDSNKVIRTFDKDSNVYVDMRIYHPGEGTLYKLAPVMQEGGTLVTNEDCGAFEFDCNGEVNNNGKNINIKPATTINFSNTSARIKMDEGIFKSGITQSETSPVYLRGKNGNFWKGLLLDELSEVEISTTYFENISPYPVDSTYAIQLIDCEYISITSSHFTDYLDIKTGGILVNYTSELRAKEAYLNYNHFQKNANSGGEGNRWV